MGPWRLLSAAPGREIITTLASKWPLRGADLWHLALAKTIQDELPELVLLTYDNRLHAATHGEGLGATGGCSTR